jgi:hypothetical protein
MLLFLPYKVMVFSGTEMMGAPDLICSTSAFCPMNKGRRPYGNGMVITGRHFAEILTLKLAASDQQHRHQLMSQHL